MGLRSTLLSVRADRQVPDPSVAAPKLGRRTQEALAYALVVHGAQVRKALPVPYVSHLLAVASIVLEDGGDETQAVAALLHDAAEDQGGEARLADIRHRFGPDVATIVAALSDSLVADPAQKAPWRARKDAYLRHLRLERDERILRVALADKLHNARSIQTDLGEPLLVISLFGAPTIGEYADYLEHQYPTAVARLLGTEGATPAPALGLAPRHDGSRDRRDLRGSLAQQREGRRAAR